MWTERTYTVEEGRKRQQDTLKIGLKRELAENAIT
jgi:hypothetical protein